MWHAGILVPDQGSIPCPRPPVKVQSITTGPPGSFCILSVLHAHVSVISEGSVPSNDILLGQLMFFQMYTLNVDRHQLAFYRTCTKLNPTQ